MDVPVFTDPLDLYEYVVKTGPDVDSSVLDRGRRDALAGQTAEGLLTFLVEVYDDLPKDMKEQLFATVRKNIRLTAGDESCIELADFVAAPWDCFA